MNNYMQKSPECPEHKGEFLIKQPLTIIVRDSNELNRFSPFYCPKSNKYLMNEKLVSMEEIVLNYLNFNRKGKKFKLEELEIHKD